MLSNLRKLKDIFTRREQLQLIGLLFAIIAMSFLQAIGIASVLPFIALIMEPNMIFDNYWLNLIFETLNFRSIRLFIIFVGLTMFCLIIVSNAVSAIATWLNIKFSLMLNHRLSRRLLEKYLNMPYAFFLNRNSSDLSNKILHEVTGLTAGYVTPILNFITRALVTIFILSMLLLVDVWVSLAAIVLLGCTYGFFFWRINRSLTYRGARQAEIAQLLFKAVNEAFGGIKEVKVLNKEAYFVENYSEHSLKLARLASWHQVIAQLPRFVLEAVAFGGIIIFVLYLLLTQKDARQVIPLASLFAFAGYRLMPALSEMFQSAASIKYTQVILDRVHSDIVEGAKAETNIESSQISTLQPLKFESEILLKNIDYSYPNAPRQILFNINVAIKHNTSVAFIGPTGAGKTTLVDIILGLLMPQEGLLLVDGVPVAENNVKHWQQNLGYVPQQIYLSDDTVKRNIAFGLADCEIDHAEIERAARIANIHEFISEELPEQYKTMVGERGVRLSGGQRQRIGIARALYHEPKIIVFDEATSALDGATEDGVLEALENAARSKTLIIIAHRLTTVKNCEMVYILERGKIVAGGTYNHLMETNAAFQKMAKVKR